MTTVTDQKITTVRDELARLFAEERELDRQLVAELASISASGSAGRRARARVEELRAKIEDAREERARAAGVLIQAEGAALIAQGEELIGRARELRAQEQALLDQLVELTGWHYRPRAPVEFLAPHRIQHLEDQAYFATQHGRDLAARPLFPRGELIGLEGGDAGLWAAYEAADPATLMPTREDVRAWLADSSSSERPRRRLGWAEGAAIDYRRSL